MRVGMGYDVHRLVEGRKLILGGVEIPYEKGLLGHSDADVLIHAIMDALLGAAALGDIGKHFPDTDPQYKGISKMCIRDRNKVLQSAGRVIRTKEDRGVILLLDERFCEWEYRGMFPREWTDVRSCGLWNVEEELAAFWKS